MPAVPTNNEEARTKFREPWFLSNDDDLDSEGWCITDGVETFSIAASSQTEFGLAVQGTIERALAARRLPVSGDNQKLIDEAQNYRGDNGTQRWPALIVELATALAARRLPVSGDTSDGYHTFDELYDYRMLYNAHAAQSWLAAGIPVVKSWRHSDGELAFGGGWFVVSAQLTTGQVTNHYRTEHWDLFDVPEVEQAPAWDGHTPAIAAERLRAALTAPTESKEPDPKLDPEPIATGYSEGVRGELLRVPYYEPMNLYHRFLPREGYSQNPADYGIEVPHE